MNLWKKLFNSKAKINSSASEYEKLYDSKGKWIIEVQNKTDVFSGEPFVVYAIPDLNKVFSDPNPPSCFKFSARSQDYWNKQDIEQKRTLLAIAYLQHINSAVVLATFDFLDGMNSFLLKLSFVEQLRNPCEEISKAAAKAIWKSEVNENCKSSVKILRDEINGKSNQIIGREDAIKALDILVDSAPGQEAKIGIQQIVEKEIVIEERIKKVNYSSVKFVKKEVKGGNTYEVYNAINMSIAKSFLINKVAPEPYYYIEVETPEGNVGKDIRGMYTF